MRMLMFAPIMDLDAPLPFALVALDEPAVGELIQRLVDIQVVVCQQLGFESLRPIQQSSFTVSHGPQSCKEQPHHGLQFPERVVREEAGPDIPRPGHGSILSLRSLSARPPMIRPSPGAIWTYVERTPPVVGPGKTPPDVRAAQRLTALARRRGLRQQQLARIVGIHAPGVLALRLTLERCRPRHAR
jgi:hypothetical protein